MAGGGLHDDAVRTGANNALTDVTGLRVGHARVPGALSGTTVVLAPPGGAVAGVDVRGAAPGTRETGSVVLHEHYFANLGGSGKPASGTLDLIKSAFGSVETWEAEFRRTANALGGGSGWVVLAFNLHTGETHNYWAWDHMHNAVLGVPLLVLDMYEHAYHMDFGAAAARYVDAFMENVNWEEVGRRAEWAQKARR